MKVHFSRLLLILLPLVAGEAFAAKGLVIYKSHPDNPDDLAVVFEYADFKNFGTVVHATGVDGEDVARIPPKNIVKNVEFVDFSSGTFTTAEQLEQLKAIPPALGVLAKRFPRARDLLADEARRINAAVQLLEQGKILVAGQWRDKTEMATTSSSSGESLTITTEAGESRTYTGVRVTGQEPDSLRIMHSGGAATIPYERLTKEDQGRYGFNPTKAEEFRRQKVMPPQQANAPPAPSGESFVGTWVVVPATANSMNLLGNVMTYLRRYEVREDGTLTSYQKVLENGAMKSDWQKAENHNWRPVNGMLTDTEEPWQGFVIGGLEWGGVFVLRDGKLVHTKNSAAVSQFAALGKMRDTESLSEDELKAIRNISTADLADDFAEEYVRERHADSKETPVGGIAPAKVDSNLTPLDPSDFAGESKAMGFLAANIHRIDFGTPLQLSPSLKAAGFTLEYRPSEYAADHLDDLKTATALRSAGKLGDLWEFAKAREMRIPDIRGEEPEKKRLRALTYFRVRLLLKGDASVVEKMASKSMAVMALGFSNEAGFLKHRLSRELGWEGWSGSPHAEIFRQEQLNPLPGNIGYAIEWNFSNGDTYLLPTGGLNAHVGEHFAEVAKDLYSDAWNSLNTLKLDSDKLIGLGELDDEGAQQRLEDQFSKESLRLISLFDKR